MAEVNNYTCIHTVQGVCGHPKLVGTDDWPGEVSPNYCARYLYREANIDNLGVEKIFSTDPDKWTGSDDAIEDSLDRAEVCNDCY